MPITVFHQLTATSPDITSGASSGEIRPSAWNSEHAVSVSLANSEVVKYVVAGSSTISSGSLQFQNANNVSFGMAFGIITGSINALTSQSVQTQGIQSISAGGNSVGGGQVVFSNANGLAFGLNGSTITGSYTVPTQSAQSMGVYASSQTTGASSSSTVDARSLSFVGAGGVSVGLTNGSVVISGATGGGAGDGFNILAAGTQTANTQTTVQFANSNGISFGMSGSAQITASHNALTSQSAQAVSAANGSSAFQTLSFGDSNGLSFSVSNGSVVGSFSQTNQTIGFFAVSNTTQGSSGTLDARTVSFRGAGIASVGMSNGSVVISVPAGGGGGDGGNVLAAGTETATTLGTVLFSNSNGVSFGMSGSTRITASVAAQILGIYAVSNSTQGSSGTIDARTLSFQGAGIASVGVSNGSVVISVPAGGGVGDGGNVIIAGTQTATTLGSVSFADSNGISFGLSGSTRLTASHNGLTSQSNQALSAANGSFSFQTASFSNANGVSFGTSAGSAITASVAAQTAQTMGLYASSNTTGQSSSSTVDARSLSIRGMGNISVGLSGGEFVISGSGGGGGGGVNLSAGANSISDALVVFSNSNGISFALNGSTITASHNGLTSQSAQALSAANGSFAFQTASFSNANGISFGTSAGSAITASHNALTTAALSNHSHGNPTLALTNLTGTTASASNGFTLSLSAAVATAGTVLTVYGVGNSTVNSSGTLPVSAMSIRGYGVLSVGTSNGSLLLSTPDPVDFTQLSVGFSTGGNTAGTTGLVTGQMVLAGGANITLSGSTNGNSMTVSVVGGAGGGGGVAISGGTQSVSTGTMVFSNSNNLSFGMSGSSRMTMSGALNLYGLGNTTQNSSTVLGLGAVSLNGIGALTVGYSNGSVQLSAPATSSLSATGAVSISTNGSTISIGVPQFSFYASSNTTAQSSSSSFSHGSLSFRGAGGVSVGFSAGEVVISGGAGAAVTASAANGSYTIGNLSFSNANGISWSTSAGSAIVGSHNGLTTAAASNHSHGNPTLNLSNLSGTTASASNGLTLSLSAPATSSLSATGQVSISVNGSTISIGVPAMATLSRFVFPDPSVALDVSGATNNSISFNYVSLDKYVSGSMLRALFSINAPLTLTTATFGISIEAGIYTRNASTISLASSGSQSYSGTFSTNGTSSIGGVRELTLPMNVNASPGEYWVGMRVSSSSSNTSLGMSLYQMSDQQTGYYAPARIGAVSATSQLLFPFHGMYSTTSGALPASVTLNQVLGSGTQGSRARFFFDLANYTVV